MILCIPVCKGMASPRATGQCVSADPSFSDNGNRSGGNQWAGLVSEQVWPLAQYTCVCFLKKSYKNQSMNPPHWEGRCSLPFFPAIYFICLEALGPEWFFEITPLRALNFPSRSLQEPERNKDTVSVARLVSRLVKHTVEKSARIRL